MANSGGKKSQLQKSKTSLQRRKKTERIGSDAAEQRKLDDQDSKQEETYKTLVENIPCAVYSAFPGERGPTTFMSKNWNDWTGYSAKELYQDPEAWPKCIYPDDREKAVNAYIEACRNKAPYNLEYRIVHRDTGQVRYVSDQGLLSKDTKGTLIRVDGIITDITEFKTSENELVKYRDHLEELVKERTAELEKANEVLKQQVQDRKKAEDTLRQNEERLSAFMDSATDGFILFDSEFNHLEMNNSALAITGLERKDVKGKNILDMAPGLKETGRYDEYKKVIKTGVPFLVSEFRPHPKYGNKHIELKAFKVGDGLGIIVTNITERKKAEEKLLGHQAKLKSLASQLSLIEERERRRIATELHDQIGQSLVFSKLKLDELQQSATSSELTKALNEICNNIVQVIQDTRTLTFDLSSPILNELGFEAAVTS